MTEILDKQILGSSAMQWLIAVTVLVLAFVLLKIIVSFLGRRMEKFAGRTKTQWDNTFAAAIIKTRTLFLFIVALYLGSLFLILPPRAQVMLQSVVIISLLIQAGIWADVISISMLNQYRKQAIEKNPAAATTISAMGFLGKVIVWAVVVLLALDNLGIDITTLVAGLGIGGVAVALALQNILGDLFASLSIILDKPFVIKDFLIIDDLMGSVEHVGLKTTRVRSLSGEQLVISNSDLLKSRIRNYGRMFERRVVFSIGVVYDTPREKLKLIPDIIKSAIESQDKTRFDRSHFQKYGDYALLFESVYYVLGPDYNVYMDIQQAINFTIHERFEQEQIQFAYPTQTVLVKQVQE